MNSALPEMLHCLSNNSGNIEMSVLERQRARLKWQQQQLIQQQPCTYFDENDPLGGVLFIGNHDPGLGELMVSRVMKPDPGTENGWNDDFGRVLNSGNRPEFERSSAIPRTVSCPPSVAAAMAEVAASNGKEAALSSATGGESFKKRKADDTKNLKVVAEEKSMEKKVKGCTEEESNITELNSNSKGTTTTTATKNNNQKGPSKENSKGSEVPKPDYIHVRARRGEATDSHSLAERVRREKISERMKYLQDLVPGCNKISGKAGMLDEIINYVQSLQRQVEFLSMKLAAFNPRLDFGMDNYLAKEMFPSCASSIPMMGDLCPQMFPSCASSIPMMGVSSDTVNPDHLEFNALAQGVSSSGLEMGVNSPDITLRRTISAPVSIPGTLLDSSCLNQIQQLSWDAELQNLYSVEYQQERSASFISQSFTGFVEAGHVKLEM